MSTPPPEGGAVREPRPWRLDLLAWHRRQRATTGLPEPGQTLELLRAFEPAKAAQDRDWAAHCRGSGLAAAAVRRRSAAAAGAVTAAARAQRDDIFLEVGMMSLVKSVRALEEKKVAPQIVVEAQQHAFDDTAARRRALEAVAELHRCACSEDAARPHRPDAVAAGAALQERLDKAEAAAAAARPGFAERLGAEAVRAGHCALRRDTVLRELRSDPAGVVTAVLPSGTELRWAPGHTQLCGELTMPCGARLTAACGVETAGRRELRLCPAGGGDEEVVLRSAGPAEWDPRPGLGRAQRCAWGAVGGATWPEAAERWRDLTEWLGCAAVLRVLMALPSERVDTDT
eukprot:TRINITY_DN23342_c0_g1_i1.p2 TRINITY_DN23342_c0_g1~~TRINITY_DN23342_c0_g1_i1.p2  ORF type:complete len:377 (+),score=118.20 TRINITY_DN23342_c0_g1_i1:100-1131(+)